MKYVYIYIFFFVFPLGQHPAFPSSVRISAHDSEAGGQLHVQACSLVRKGLSACGFVRFVSVGLKIGNYIIIRWNDRLS